MRAGSCGAQHAPRARRRGAAGAGEELVAGKGAAKGYVRVKDVDILVAWESTFSLLLFRSF